MNLKKCEFESLIFILETGKIKDGETVKSLENKGLVKNGNITKKGFSELEPYRVKRAVLFAAGRGERLRPLTDTIPKPLIRVKSKRIIDTLIDACLEAGIEEIYVVRGYLAAVFDELKEKYPNIHFIDNEIYNECNNISSAYAAREYINNAYLFESDLVLANPKLIKKYQYSSNVLGIKAEKCDDWTVLVDENGFVYDHVKGAENCYKQVGIYYINEQDGKKYAGHVSAAMDTVEGRMMFWEDVIHKLHRDEYEISIRECLEEDTMEIDSLQELIAIDKSYEK
ncbi:MAG: NTP transferase domain-containing protein [Clostridia bacterium]|nr:NTP transferase domain-containing protein [Clostridia bacterium]